MRYLAPLLTMFSVLSMLMIGACGAEEEPTLGSSPMEAPAERATPEARDRPAVVVQEAARPTVVVQAPARPTVTVEAPPPPSLPRPPSITVTPPSPPSVQVN